MGKRLPRGRGPQPQKAENRGDPKGKKDRLSVSLTLDNKKGKRTLDTKIVLDIGDYFVLALSSPKEDRVDLAAFTCKIK